MSYEVAVYRGSFDPPHIGHLEAVTSALEEGIAPIFIVYKDTNKHKPFRCDNKTRKKLLVAMFCDMPNVVISSKSYKHVIGELQQDSTISKIYQIIGSDILTQPVRPIPLPSNLAYFVHSRTEYPFREMKLWNNLPVKIASLNPKGLNPSSSFIKSLLKNRDFETAEKYFPPRVFEQIQNGRLYVPTEIEFPFRDMIAEVQKSIEKKILTHTPLKEDEFPLKFKLGQDIGISGQSGDLICFISNNQNQMRLVVKIFLGENHLERYKSELLGYQVLSNLNLTLVKTPVLYISEVEQNFTFICMSYVTGKPLAELMNSSEEPIRLCARANLELHTAQRAPADKISLTQIELFEQAMQKVTEKMQGMGSGHVSPEAITKLNNHWVARRLAFLSNPGEFSFTHGDPNHTNGLVAPDLQHVTYIDLSLFNRSVNDQHNPCGFAMNELEESLITFKIAGRRLGLEKEKIQEIQNVYRKEYLSLLPPDFATQEAREYFEAYWILRVIDNIIDKWNATDSTKEKSKHLIQIHDQMNQFLKTHQ